MQLTLPDNAPFTGTQKMWIKGFLDGINSTLAQQSGAPPGSAVAAPLTNGRSVTIAFGSQTGTAESLSKKLAKKLVTLGHQPIVKDLAEVRVEELATLEYLLIVTSTYGDGEPPDNAAAIHQSLHAAAAPKLPSLTFAVLALGDSDYAEFCKCGRDFDQQLAALGAKRLAPIVECDVDFDEPFEAWVSKLGESLAAV